jgi:glycosyltransferase involved in cell wall biosynthesis
VQPSAQPDHRRTERADNERGLEGGVVEQVRHRRSIAQMPAHPRRRREGAFVVAHLTTVDMSLRYLLLAQLRAVRDAGGIAIGISAPGPHVAALEAEGIRHIPLHASTRAADPRADLRAARELLRILQRERVDVLHTHNPKPGFYGRIVGRVARVPIVVNTVHGLYATPDDPWTKRAVVYGLEAIAARCSDAELYQNIEDLEFMQQWHLTRRASLLGNGVDLRRFDRARVGPEARTAMRAELGATDDTIVVGSVGRLVAEKGYPELFEAMAGLDPSRFLLVVAGDRDPDKPDSLDPAVVDAAQARGVRFVGHREDVEHFYPGLDLFVLASHREGFPRVAMEAAAMGLPVVTTDVRGCRQVVDHGVNGLLVPVRDPGALQAAIVTLSENSERRSEMGDASRAKARKEFDEQTVVARVFAAYLDTARTRGIRLNGLEEWASVRDNHSPSR